MNVLKKLQDLQPSKPYYGFAKLTVGYHKINVFRVVKNKFGNKGEKTGKSILVELKNEVIFLPQYFLGKINEEDIKELNSCDENMYLYFGGRSEQSR